MIALHRLPMTVWLILFPALAALLVASHMDHSAERWHPPLDLGSAAALSEPALLADPAAVIWRSGAGMVYQRLDNRLSRHAILSYPDVHPRRWQVGSAASGRFHIVWLEENDRLRSALISVDGETLRGPILLADAVRPDFVTLPADESLIVIWLNDHADEVNALTIDSAGRPGPITNIPVSRVIRVAAVIDAANMVHLAWLTAPTPDTWAIHYQVVDPAAFNMANPITFQSFTPDTGESITGLAIGLDPTHVYILLSTSGAQQPDVDRIQMLSFPRDAPSQGQLTDLSLSGYALRWPRPVPGQNGTLSLAVHVRTPDGWRPAVVSFQQGSMVDYAIAASLPADAGPSALLADSSGGLILAWTGLDGIEPQVYVSRTTDSGWTAGDASDHAVLQTLAGAGVGFVLMVIWLILPGCLLWLVPNRAIVTLLALTFYTAAKLIWPAVLFSRLPPWMIAVDLDRYVSPPWIIGLAVLLIGILSALVWGGARPRSYRTRTILYLLTDAILTSLIFGANVFN